MVKPHRSCGNSLGVSKSSSDLQFCDVIAEMIDANLNALVDRAAMRCSVIEASARDVVGILETLAVHNKPLHLMSVVGHWVKTGDDALSDFAATLAKSGSQTRIVSRSGDRRKERPDNRESQKNEWKELGRASRKTPPEKHQSSTDGDKDEPRSCKRPLAITTLANIKYDVVFHGVIVLKFCGLCSRNLTVAYRSKSPLSSICSGQNLQIKFKLDKSC